MVGAEHFLAGVAEGCMAEVMQQCRGVENTLLFLQGGVELDQPSHGAASDGEDAQRMGEPARFSAVKRQERRSKLPDASKPLEWSRIHKREHHRFGRFGGVQADAVMQRIVISA